MQGKRHDIDLYRMEPGEYGQWPAGDGIWYCCTPNGHHGSLRGHEVVEHEDGTITVSPSIQVMGGRGMEEELWHGWLQHGVWSEA